MNERSYDSFIEGEWLYRYDGKKNDITNYVGYFFSSLLKMESPTKKELQLRNCSHQTNLRTFLCVAEYWFVP